MGASFLSSLRIDVRPCEKGYPVMMRVAAVGAIPDSKGGVGVMGKSCFIGGWALLKLAI